MKRKNETLQIHDQRKMHVTEIHAPGKRVRKKGARDDDEVVDAHRCEGLVKSQQHALETHADGLGEE